MTSSTSIATDKEMAMRASDVFVEYALKIRALELVPEGRKLKNGRVSPYFFNSGLFNTGGRMGELVGYWADSIEESFATPDQMYFKFDVLYGPPYKGTLLVPAIAIELSSRMEQDVRICSSRKEVKTHGDGGVLIGSPIREGDRVLIVDDVITDGGTKREAVELIRSFGGVPVGLAIAFDRQERGAQSDLSATKQFELEFGIPVCPIAGLSDLVEVLGGMPPESGDDNIGEMLDKVLAYQAEYGVAS